MLHPTAFVLTRELGFQWASLLASGPEKTYPSSYAIKDGRKSYTVENLLPPAVKSIDTLHFLVQYCDLIKAVHSCMCV